MSRGTFPAPVVTGVVTGVFIGFLIVVGGLGVPAVSTAIAAELRIDVTGLRSATGTVHLAVYNSADKFPTSDGLLVEKVVKVTENKIKAVFSQLPPGEYAVAVYHDENNNREFDRGFFGFPLEGFAFSNGANVVFGPPEFSAAAVPVNDDGSDISIRMTYW